MATTASTTDGVSGDVSNGCRGSLSSFPEPLPAGRTCGDIGGVYIGKTFVATCFALDEFEASAGSGSGDAPPPPVFVVSTAAIVCNDFVAKCSFFHNPPTFDLAFPLDLGDGAAAITTTSANDPKVDTDPFPLGSPPPPAARLFSSVAACRLLSCRTPVEPNPAFSRVGPVNPVLIVRLGCF